MNIKVCCHFKLALYFFSGFNCFFFWDCTKHSSILFHKYIHYHVLTIVRMVIEFLLWLIKLSEVHGLFEILESFNGVVWALWIKIGDALLVIMHARTTPSYDNRISNSLTSYVSAICLKYLVWWTGFFFLSLNWIFAGYTGSKYLIQTGKKIQFIKFEISNWWMSKINQVQIDRG